MHKVGSTNCNALAAENAHNIHHKIGSFATDMFTNFVASRPFLLGERSHAICLEIPPLSSGYVMCTAVNKLGWQPFGSKARHVHEMIRSSSSDALDDSLLLMAGSRSLS